ncbi:MAG: desulfoferrodoxin [Actinobacteria bacterium]|nr:desulfoferrodoxin [Acidimicrobiia bacterium]PHX59366.1 MAG: desulfoferrodoxin [Actinomycetota bacterium]
MTEAKIGSRLRCQKCTTELIVVKQGEAEIECCGEPMKLRT